MAAPLASVVPLAAAVPPNASWRGRSVLDRDLWQSALLANRALLRDMVAVAACCWLTTALFSLGDVFSLQPMRLQSRRQVLVANVIWYDTIYMVIHIAAHVPALQRLRFLEHPDRPPSAWLCVKTFAIATAPYVLASLALSLGNALLVAHFSSKSEAFFNVKLDFYATNILGAVFHAGSAISYRNIVYTKTTAGPARLVHKQRRGAIAANATAPAPQPSSPSDIPTIYRRPRFLPALLRALPLHVASLAAGGYVHLVSQWRVVASGSAVVLAFLVASTLFKLAVQEGARRAMIHHRVINARIMSVAVGVPTVLIDTQARIVLLGAQSSRLVTVALGVIEIAVRVGKLALLKRSISRRERQLFNGGTAPAAASEISRKSNNCHSDKQTELEAVFLRWKRQVLDLHTAEVLADMYAEYMALSCSAAVLCFYWRSSHYTRLRAVASLNPSSPVAIRSQIESLASQFAVELVVDFIAVALESCAGLPFGLNPRLRAFLPVVLLTSSVLNVTICATMYLS